MASSTRLAFRDADPSEDDDLARICYNAFLPVWLHNWFQCIDKPIAAVPSASYPTTTLQARRIAFYRAWIALNRAYNGDVIVAYTPTDDDSNGVDGFSGETSSPSKLSKIPSGPIAAVVFLLPPNARPSWGDLGTALRTGYFQGLLSFGLHGFWRMVFTFEGNVQKMIGRGLKQRKIGQGKETNLLFVQVCVRNPEWQGPERGPARKLLDWGIHRWWQRHERIPCWLDCFSDEAERTYLELGFELLDTCMVDTGCDRDGMPLKKDATEEEREQGRAIAKQRVMIKMPHA